MDQSLGGSEAINVRWAESDPNPGVQAKRQQRNEDMLGDAVDRRIAELRGEHAAPDDPRLAKRPRADPGPTGPPGSAHVIQTPQAYGKGGGLSHGAAVAMVLPEVTGMAGFQYPNTDSQYNAPGSVAHQQPGGAPDAQWCYPDTNAQYSTAVASGYPDTDAQYAAFTESRAAAFKFNNAAANASSGEDDEGSSDDGTSALGGLAGYGSD